MHPGALIGINCLNNYSQRLEPEFEKAATLLVDKGITLGKVDCTQELYLAQRYNIRAYPSLRIFYNGMIYHY
jgi:protein disulfide-isomerase A1